MSELTDRLRELIQRLDEIRHGRESVPERLAATTRWDSECAAFLAESGTELLRVVEKATFARRLERELAQALAANAQLAHALRCIIERHDNDEFMPTEFIEQARAALAEENGAQPCQGGHWIAVAARRSAPEALCSFCRRPAESHAAPSREGGKS